MNYQTLVSQRQSSYSLDKENAIINNISKGKIFEAEIIAKKSLVPKESSLIQAYRKKQEISSPLYKAITAPKPTPTMINYDQLSDAFRRAIEDVRGDEPRVDSPTIEEVIEKPTPVQPIAGHKIGDTMFMVVRKHDNLDEMGMDDLDSYVTNYKDELGKFRNHMANTRATDAMKQHNTFDFHQDAFQRSLEYGRYLDKYLQFREQPQEGESIMTNLEDVYDRFTILLGEIRSGNKNKRLINEFRDIIYYLYKNDHMSKNNYDALMKI